MDPLPTPESIIDGVEGMVSLYKVSTPTHLTMVASKLDLSCAHLYPMYLILLVRFDMEGIPVRLPDCAREWAYRHQDTVGVNLTPLTILNSLLDCQLTLIERTRERALLKMDSLLDMVEPEWRAHSPDVAYYPVGPTERALIEGGLEEPLGGGVGAPPSEKARKTHYTQNTGGGPE